MSKTNEDHRMSQSPSFDAETLVEPLLAVHSAPSVAWLADSATTAAERGLGALYSFLCVSTEAGRGSAGQLAVVKPASGTQGRSQARLRHAFNADIFVLKFDLEEHRQLADAMEQSHAIVVPELSGVLPLDAESLQRAQGELGVAEVWLLPLHLNGATSGLQILLMGDSASSRLEEAELLGRHIAVALAKLRDLEASRRRGDVDAVRWIYDERRFQEELGQETRRAQRHHRPLSVLLLRILNLDDIQRRYGRFLAERVLRQVAARLDDAMRDTDFLGSSGEDGFATILVEADHAGADRARTRLLEGLHTMKLSDTNLPSLELRLACATATLVEDGENMQELLSAVAERLREQEVVQEDVAAAG